MMLAIAGILLSSCTADETEFQTENRSFDNVEASPELQSKAGDTMPSGSEPIIVIPPRK